MSITDARKFMEKSGCGLIFGVGIAALMALGLFQGTCGRANNMAAQQAEQGGQLPAVMAIGDQKITAKDIDDTYQRDLANQEEQLRPIYEQMGGFEGLMPGDRMLALGTTVDRYANSLYLLSIAKDLDIKIDDASIMSIASQELERSIADARQQLIQQGKLKKDASDADFIKAFKEAAGQTPDEIRSKQRSELQTALQSPDTRFQLTTFAVNSALKQQFSKEVNATDDKVKQDFDTYTVKLIVFGGKGIGDANVMDVVNKVKKDLENGSKFEAAMEQYSTATPPKGKSITEVTQDLPRPQIESSDILKPLLLLKPGMISTPIITPQGPTLFKLIKIDRNIPKDYATNPELYKSKYVERMAQDRINERMQEKQKSGLVVWSDLGYKSLADVTSSLSGRINEESALKKVLTERLEEIKKNRASADPAKQIFFDNRAGAFAEYLAMQRLWELSNNEEKAKLREQWIGAMQSVLDTIEDTSIRLAMVEQLIEAKSDAAAENLLQAAQANSSFGSNGQRNYQQIFTYYDKLKKANLLPADIAKQIDEEQQRWIKDKKAHDADVAEQKAEREKAEKEAAAERAKAEEEMKKEKAEANKGPSSSDLTNPKAPN